MKALLAGRVVPVIGLDGAGDLAEHLAKAFARPGRPPDRPRADLAVRRDDAGLGSAVRRAARALRSGRRAGSAPSFPRTLPALLRERGAPHQLIVTTNYDLALERAFEEAGEEVDIVAYVATGTHRGRFWHRPPGRAAEADRRTEHVRDRAQPRPPHDHPEAPRSRRSAAGARVGELRHHRGRLHRLPRPIGADAPSSRSPSRRGCAVATSSSSATRWPTGTSGSILNRIWGERPVGYRSWAVQRTPSPLAQAFWRRFDVTPLDVEPHAYVELLERRLEAA